MATGRIIRDREALTVAWRTLDSWCGFVRAMWRILSVTVNEMEKEVISNSLVCKVHDLNAYWTTYLYERSYHVFSSNETNFKEYCLSVLTMGLDNLSWSEDCRIASFT